jgi:uncharacterized protein
MLEDLQNLLELSAMDKKVHELRLSKRDLPLRIQNLRAEIEREKQKLDSLMGSIAETRKKIQENQDLNQQEDAALTESNRRLNEIKTNREYDAIHSEIATHRKNIETAKANAIHFQQILENFQKDVEAVDSVYKTVVETNQPELDKLTEELGGIEDRISEQQKMAEGPRATISKRVTTVYDRIVGRRGTPNVIARVNMSKRSCDVCSRTQSPQRLVETSKRTAIMTCESCGSILIWKDDIASDD